MVFLDHDSTFVKANSSYLSMPLKTCPYIEHTRKVLNCFTNVYPNVHCNIYFDIYLIVYCNVELDIQRNAEFDI